MEVEHEQDAGLLISVLPSARIADLKRTFNRHGMKFPDDYFVTMRKYALVIDPPANSVPDPFLVSCGPAIDRRMVCRMAGGRH